MSPRVVKSAMIEQVIRAAVDFGAATDSVTDAAASALGINRTDMRMLSLVRNRGPQSVGWLAQAAGLSPAAATSVVRRLVGAGYVAQERDRADGRRMVITLTERARTQLRSLYGPMLDQGRGWLSDLTLSQLQLLQRFLVEAEQLQLDLASSLRADRLRSSR